MKQVVSVELSGGKRLTFETGKLAKQAHGSTLVLMGDNVVLATAVANADPREGIDFFPLTVDQPANRSSHPAALPRRIPL
jgi:polyribonucleotide nucleotidyltransferase